MLTTLNHRQLQILRVLKRKPHTTSETAELVAKKKNLKYSSSYFAIHAHLRRLEDEGYVRRIFESWTGMKTVWELTEQGRKSVS